MPCRHLLPEKPRHLNPKATPVRPARGISRGGTRLNEKCADRAATDDVVAYEVA